MSSEELRLGGGASIELRGVTKRYRDAVAVDAIDLKIEDGEFMTLLGPSGSGKTTTLNLIAGFTDVTAGEITIAGRSVEKVPPQKRGIGFVFQHYALFPHMTVEQNIAFPLQQRKVPKARQRELVALALEAVRLGGYGKRYPNELSGGQQQRVAVARAIVFSPPVLLMDEPLGALDRKLREWLQLEIKRIHREVGSTFVYVTHDQEEALVLSDRIAVFNRGRIDQVGSAQELYERPRTLFVGRFIGESTVLRGDLATNGSDSVLRTGDHAVHVPGRLPGQTRAAVLIRPERLGIATDPDAVPPGRNQLPARVLETVYLGAAWKYEVKLPDGTTGVVRTSGQSSVGVNVGDDVHIYWDPSHGVLLADDPDVDHILT